MLSALNTVNRAGVNRQQQIKQETERKGYRRSVPQANWTRFPSGRRRPATTEARAKPAMPVGGCESNFPAPDAAHRQ